MIQRPQIAVERPIFLDQIEDCASVLDGSHDLAPVAHDTAVLEKALQVVRPIGCDSLQMELIEAYDEPGLLFPYHWPTEAGPEYRLG